MKENAVFSPRHSETSSLPTTPPSPIEFTRQHSAPAQLPKQSNPTRPQQELSVVRLIRQNTAPVIFQPAPQTAEVIKAQCRRTLGQLRIYNSYKPSYNHSQLVAPWLQSLTMHFENIPKRLRLLNKPELTSTAAEVSKFSEHALRYIKLIDGIAKGNNKELTGLLTTHIKNKTAIDRSFVELFEAMQKHLPDSYLQEELLGYEQAKVNLAAQQKMRLG